MEYISEYDAFGPWIYEIDEKHGIPEIFREYYNEHEQPLILFKVPRSIERRNAFPMDLYDYLIGAYDKYLLILKRTGKRVTRQRIYYSDISAIKDMHALLKGELTLFTQDSPAVILYNTVSEEIIFKLVNIIKKKTCFEGRTIRMESIPAEYSADESTIDILFFNLFNRLQKADPALRLIAYQPALWIRRTRDLKQRLRKEKLQPSKTAFIVNDKELIVLERDMLAKKKNKAGLDFSYLYTPLQSITGAELKELDSGQDLFILKIKIKSQIFSYIFEGRNKRMFDLYHKLCDLNRIA